MQVELPGAWYCAVRRQPEQLWVVMSQNLQPMPPRRPALCALSTSYTALFLYVHYRQRLHDVLQASCFVRTLVQRSAMRLASDVAPRREQPAGRTAQHSSLGRIGGRVSHSHAKATATPPAAAAASLGQATASATARRLGMATIIPTGAASAAMALRGPA